MFNQGGSLTIAKQRQKPLHFLFGFFLFSLSPLFFVFAAFFYLLLFLFLFFLWGNLNELVLLNGRAKSTRKDAENRRADGIRPQTHFLHDGSESLGKEQVYNLQINLIKIYTN